MSRRTVKELLLSDTQVATSGSILWQGLVGSFLREIKGVTHHYNSKNIQDIKGENFDEVYFASSKLF